MQTTLTKPKKKADSHGKVRSSDIPSPQPLEDGEEEYYQTAEEFYEELREAIRDVKEHIAGRKQLQTAEEFLAELRKS